MKRSALIELPAALAQAGAHTGRQAPRWLLGADGGATKTLVAVLDLETGQVQFGRSRSSNPDVVGLGDSLGALAGAADEALERAGIGAEDLDGAVLAVAGTDLEPLAERCQERRSGWIVVNDVIAAWAAATGARAGVGVIAGTGSNVLGIGPDDRAWRAGGWGHILGDEGSGYWLAVRGLSAALHDRDGSGPETALSDAAMGFFEVGAVEEIPVKIFTRSLTKDEIAAFALTVETVALGGDPVAREIYEDGAQQLGRQIQAVIEHTKLEGEFPVGLIGSVFKAGPLFCDPLSEAIRASAPQASIATVKMAPVGGSLLLAARAAGGAECLEPARLERLLEQAQARDDAGIG